MQVRAKTQVPYTDVSDNSLYPTGDVSLINACALVSHLAHGFNYTTSSSACLSTARRLGVQYERDHLRF